MEMMRLFIAFAVVLCASADARFKMSSLPMDIGDRPLVGQGSYPLPRETGRLSVDGTKGWMPRPTAAPGAVSEGDAVLELLRQRAATSSYSWEDDTTCGWTSGVSSAPFTCPSQYSCRTNDANVVGCASGTYSPFFTVCLDMQAFEQGACASIGPQTGCCQTPGFGACGTYLWTGTPARYMYRCFPQPTIISMNDEPQAVIDAATRTTSISMSSASSTASTTATTTPADKDNDNDGDEKPSTPIGAIVGGVVGGVAGIALIAALAAWVLLRRRRAGKPYNAVPGDPFSQNSQQPPYTAEQQYPKGYQAVPSGVPTAPSTYPPTSPYPTSVSTATAYDPRSSYYDATKSPGQVSQSVYSPPPAELAGMQNPRHSAISELGTSEVSGSQGNPVEIGGK